MFSFPSLSDLFGSPYGWLIRESCPSPGWSSSPLEPVSLCGFAAGARRCAEARRSIAGELALAICVAGSPRCWCRRRRRAASRKGSSREATSAEVQSRPRAPARTRSWCAFAKTNGQPFDPEEVIVEIGNEAAGVEPAARAIRRVGPGHYSREGSELAFPGVWTIEVHARLDASGMASFRSQVPIR